MKKNRKYLSKRVWSFLMVLKKSGLMIWQKAGIEHVPSISVNKKFNKSICLPSEWRRKNLRYWWKLHGTGDLRTITYKREKAANRAFVEILLSFVHDNEEPSLGRCWFRWTRKECHLFRPSIPPRKVCRFETYCLSARRRFEPILRESHYGGALVALNDEYLLISGNCGHFSFKNRLIFWWQLSASKLDGSADGRSNFLVVLVHSAWAYFRPQDGRWPRK